MERALDRYQRLVDAEKPDIRSVEASGMRLRTAMLRPGAEPTAAIQLIEPHVGPGVDELARNGEGTLYEVAWEVEDADAAAGAMRAAGATLRDLAGNVIEGPVTARSGSRYFYLDSDATGGTRMEVIQPATEISQSPLSAEAHVGEFEGQVALVTGGASGIGASIVELLVERGARVAIFDLQAELASELATRLGGRDRCRAFAVDVTDSSAVREAVASTLEAFGTISIAVNCAGFNRFMSPEDVDDATWRRILAINLDGPWNVCSAVIPEMARRGSGRIVNIGSAAGVLGIPMAVPYSTAKHGIVGLTRSLAVDLGPHNITVNCVAPGTTLTPLVEAATSESFKRAATERTPLGRLGLPRDLAEAVLFLASDRASWITGVVLPVDGGLTAVIRAHHWE
jgi:NAD(P)-dependent dehydrogenase (short-subunit alcohol dehydrogenase family)